MWIMLNQYCCGDELELDFWGWVGKGRQTEGNEREVSHGGGWGGWCVETIVNVLGWKR